LEANSYDDDDLVWEREHDYDDDDGPTQVVIACSNVELDR